MMNAMAPNAPIGATFMIQDMILKMSSRMVSMRLMTGMQRSRPMTTMAAPKNTEKNRTCSKLLLAKAPNDAGGDDVKDEVGRVLRRRGARLRVQRFLGQCVGIDVQPGTGLDDVAYDQAEDQREERGRGEVEEGFDSDPSDRLDVAYGRDAGDDHQENQRRDDHFDELDETITERPQLRAEVRPEMSDKNTCHDGDQNLEEERPIQGLLLLRGRTRLQRRGIWDLH